MRLTLRTMLASMDDILEPADRDEIARKIEESEFARNLMQRIRESTQKSRLGAPKLSAKGLGLDANTVAEYLDNTLSGERVPDFERVCLESDMHLAEVAACHQVLTMVLGQPANVDPAMKRRMYKIAERVPATPPPRPHETPTTSAEDGAAVATEEIRVAPPRQRPEVPAYLRERNSRSMWRTVLAAILLLVLLGGAITMALGPLDGRNPVMQLLGFGKPQEEQVARNDQPNGEPTEPDSKATAAPDEPDATDAAKEPKILEATRAPDVAATTPISDAPAVDSNPPMPAPQLEQPVLPSNPGAPTLPTETQVPPEPMPPGENATPPTTTTTPNNDVLRLDPGVRPMPGDATVDSTPMPMPTPEGAVPPEPTPAAADLPLGRLIPSRGVVLLRFDPTAGGWNRVLAGAPLGAGDKLLVLPTYRPTITLSAGITLQLSSETMLELEATNAAGVPGVKLHFGRIVAMTTGHPDAKLRLDLGPVQGVVTFTDPDATLGAEVRLFHPFGVDPEKVEPQVAVDLYGARGELEWTPAGGAAINLGPSQRLVVMPHPGEPQPAGAGAATVPTLPAWIEGESLVTSQASASAILADELADEKKSLSLVLNEFAESRQIERRILSAQCLAMLDQFEPIIDGINDDRNRAYWTNLIASARNAMTRGPGAAARLREAYERKRGASNGQQLYRMLGGYTKDQLTNGNAAADLVSYLDDDNLDFRVLAITNLTEITGRPLSYRPEEKTAVNRRPAVNRWKQELTAGRIVPKEPAPPKEPQAARP